jgi:hypothetical protein
MFKDLHTFHIPVMGIGFSIDTPVKVARYGLSSVISLVDDTLIEHMRKFYCNAYQLEYNEIKSSEHDHRARRITEYLNLLDSIVRKQFEELKASAFEQGTEITKYFELLPETSPVKKLYTTMLSTQDAQEKRKIQELLREKIRPGTIDVNIMTKLDRTNFAENGDPLPEEFSDALSALRGYALSTLNSALVLSAGFNRKLYAYLEEFKDFYADKTGEIKKKIVLKVSDYRSCITQGKFLAKKGLWISEFRIESGLNCGGHAFTSNGHLLGPILEEMRTKKQEFLGSIRVVYNEAIKIKDKLMTRTPPDPKITVQGGICTHEEDRFLQEHYRVDGTGWATPFLLVPEVTNVDDETLQKLVEADEDDLYLSNSSPMGIPFNNLRTSASNLAQEKRFKENHPGSPCPLGHLSFNTEFTKNPICLGSRQYQKLKLEQIARSSDPDKNLQIEDVVAKTCICFDLGASVLIKHGMKNAAKELTPAICPGPSLAYFSRVMTLKEMVDHIYGRANVLNEKERPHMFIKELMIYINNLIDQLKRCKCTLNDNQLAQFEEFKANMIDGVAYYEKLFGKELAMAQEQKDKILKELKDLAVKIHALKLSSVNPFYQANLA